MTMAVRNNSERRPPWIQTCTAILVFFIGLVALWSAVSLLFYLEVP